MGNGDGVAIGSPDEYQMQAWIGITRTGEIRMRLPENPAFCTLLAALIQDVALKKLQAPAPRITAPPDGLIL